VNSNSAAIEAAELTKKFGHLYALREISFSQEAGKFTTIFGPNGAGKTTLIRIISTIAKATEGEVKILGLDIAKEAEKVRKHIGVIGHQTFLYEDLTAEENLRFYGKLYSVPDLNERIGSSLSEVGLAQRSKDHVRGFSRGMQQRLAIARAMLHDPDILLLDEPYTGLDQHATQILTQWLKKLREQKRTTLMVTHNIERGLELADRVFILIRGKIAFDQPKQKINDGDFKDTYYKLVADKG